jgi:hypothetical protein
MKTIRFVAMVYGLLHGLNMAGQSSMEDPSVISVCESSFITAGTGINSNYGVVGIGVDFPLIDKLQGAVSGGIGTWGFKSAGELRYFYSGCIQRGSAVAVGMSYSSGLPEMNTELETASNETKTITLELGSQTNLQASWYKSYAIKKRHRFFFQVGYSFPVSGISYKVKSGEALSDVSKTTMKMLSPGGVMIATGFGFGF